MWTDHNTHDPGITILEQLRYALADLSYRTNHEVADLIAASPTGTLPPPEELLSCDPQTAADQARTLLDIEGVSGAWIEPDDGADLGLRYHEPSAQLRLASTRLDLESRPVELRGLARARLSGASSDTVRAAAAAARTKFDQGRALCTEATIEQLSPRPIWIDAEIELDRSTSSEHCLAKIFDRLQAHLAPTPSFESLRSALVGGRSLDQLLEGPRLAHGVLRGLSEATRPRRIVYSSDLLHELSEVEGVRAVTSLALATSREGPRERWCVEVGRGEAPVLALGSAIRLLRGGIPIDVDRAAAVARYQATRRARTQRPVEQSLSRPMGRDRRVGHYRSVRHALPAVYGVGDNTLSPTAPPWRRARAKQLQAFLSIFDQLLANAFAQLEHAHELFSPRSEHERSYFAGEVKDGSTSDAQLEPGSVESHRAWLDAAVSTGAHGQLDERERARRFVDHLLARYAEQLGDTAIEHKRAFLRDYTALSHRRGTGHATLDPSSSSGLEDRLRLSLGLEADSALVVEHILLRPIPEDARQQIPGSQEELPLLDAAARPDPYSLQLSVLVRGPLAPSLARAVEQAVAAQTPAHITPYLIWLSDDDEGQDWSEHAAAISRWRSALATYRAASSTAAQPDEASQLRLRDTRDRLVDLLGLGRSRPLLDLPVGRRRTDGSVVRVDQVSFPPGRVGEIFVGHSQRGVRYQLWRRPRKQEVELAEGPPPPFAPEGPEVPGTGDTLRLETSPVDQDLEYRVLAIKPGSETSARGSFLHHGLGVVVGLDAGLDAEIQSTPRLDPKVARPTRDDARIIDHGATVEVAVWNTQEGVVYQLVGGAVSEAELLSLADASLRLSEEVIGTGNAEPIILRSTALAEDVDLRIHACKGETHSDVELAPILLDAVLPLKVRANPDIRGTITPVGTEPGAAATITLKDAQAGVFYQLWMRPIHDAEFVFDNRSKDETADLTIEGGHRVRVERPPWPPIWSAPEGFVAVGEPIPAGAGPLELLIPKVERDSFVIVRASKLHLAGPLNRPAAERIESAVQLRRGLLALTLPQADPGLELRARLEGDTVLFSLFGGEPGVLYSLETGIGELQPAYFHKYDELDPTLNKGIGQLRVGLDLVVVRSTGTPDFDSSLDSPPSPELKLRGASLDSGEFLELSKTSLPLGATKVLTQLRREIDPIHPVLEGTLQQVSGIGASYADKLVAAGIGTLAELAAIDLDQVEIEGVTPDRLASWRSMAELLSSFPQLGSEDARVLVKGLGVDSSTALERGEVDLSPERVAEVALVEGGVDYDVERLQDFLDTFRQEARE